MPRSLVVTGWGSKMVKDLTPARAMFFAIKRVSLRRSENGRELLTDLDSEAIQTDDQHIRGGHTLHGCILVELDKVLERLHEPSWPKT